MSNRMAAGSPGAGMGQADGPVRVMICDDSAVVRLLLERVLSADPGITVVAKAANGAQGLTAVREGGVDVVVLDIEMPVMDGMTALPLLLQADRDLKVLMSSTLTTRGAAIALDALRLGAADFIAKPSAAAGAAAEQAFRQEVVAKVRGLGRLRRVRRHAGLSAPAAVSAPPPSRIVLRRAPSVRPAVLAVGSSTGGPPALLSLFRALQPAPRIPVVLTQHMPPAFMAQLARHIGQLGGWTCAEAVDGEALRPGHVHLAPGDRHLLVQRHGGVACAVLGDGAPENYCRPAVDPMLRSLSAVFGSRVLAMMLTGMGQDGLAGAEQVVAAGGGVIAQDEASSVVWGMPGAVARAGLCHAVLPLPQLALHVLAAVKGAPA